MNIRFSNDLDRAYIEIGEDGVICDRHQQTMTLFDELYLAINDELRSAKYGCLTLSRPIELSDIVSLRVKYKTHKDTPTIYKEVKPRLQDDILVFDLERIYSSYLLPSTGYDDDTRLRGAFLPRTFSWGDRIEGLPSNHIDLLVFVCVIYLQSGEKKESPNIAKSAKLVVDTGVIGLVPISQLNPKMCNFSNVLRPKVIRRYFQLSLKAEDGK